MAEVAVGRSLRIITCLIHLIHCIIAALILVVLLIA
jgi:hypothetical protein